MARPAGSRWSMLQRNGLFRDTPQSNQAIAAFTELAMAHGILPAQLALAWVDQVDGVTSTIIGATNLAQLQQNMPLVKEQLQQQGYAPVLVVMPQLRPLIARYARSFSKGLKVLSYNEIPEDLRVEVIGTLG